MKINTDRKEPIYGKEPNGFLYSLVCHLSRLFLKLKYNVKIDNKAISSLKPPFIVLGNHPSKLDPFIMASALSPHRINFLGTNYYFRNPILHSAFKAGGIIPKIQFYKDIRAVRLMSRVISRGGILGICPEGQRSVTGTLLPISDAIAKSIKLYKVPVVAVVSNGAYLSLPRWSSFSRRGAIEVSVKPILSADDIQKLTVKEIHEVVCKSLDYNDFEWSKRRQISFKHKKIAERIDSILHECPSCGAENAMKSEGSRLYCRHCGNTAIMDEYGLLKPENENCIVFEDAVKWFEWQKSRMSDRLRSDDFAINSRVTELRIAESLTGSYHKAGFGELVLNKEGLAFKGIINSIKEEVFFPPRVLSSMVFDFGINFEITDGKNTYCFDLEEGQDAVRFQLVVNHLFV